MMDYHGQEALFDGHDIDVEFNRRYQWVAHDTQGPSGSRRQPSIHQIEPIELLVDRMQVTQDHDNPAHFEFRIPFLGDEELFRLRPAFDPRWVWGNVFRGDLILDYLADSEEEARHWFEQDMTTIRDILELQRERIERFNAQLCEEDSQAFQLMVTFGKSDPPPAGWSVGLTKSWDQFRPH